MVGVWWCCWQKERNLINSWNTINRWHMRWHMEQRQHGWQLWQLAQRLAQLMIFWWWWWWLWWRSLLVAQQQLMLCGQHWWQGLEQQRQQLGQKGWFYRTFWIWFEFGWIWWRFAYFLYLIWMKNRLELFLFKYSDSYSIECN